ncbi:DUF721 domain-containing protein [Xenorhabdus budapestensis]|uniref:DUF721 domain-containing protein n=1 Tax=Xenorhabdus budapestensis TaxID=290110 RepID=A0ABX7VEM2_XENBU|nr:DciA family protein [Xenorhabdus budapestensis]QTL39239.1 DUF721 domain-containing protein [Xenorhabdus budapestensis]
MRDSRPQSLETLLSEPLFENAATAGKSPLQTIQRHAIALLKLNRTVLSLLPVQLRPWCRVANYRKQILVLEAGNASWKTRLYYEIPILLSALRCEILPSLSSIDIRINPSLMVKSRNNGQNVEKISAKKLNNDNRDLPIRQLSHESAETLKILAEHCPEKLKRKLERLAALAGESTSTAKMKD